MYFNSLPKVVKPAHGIAVQLFKYHKDQCEGCFIFSVVNKEEVVINFLAASPGNLCCSSEALLRKAAGLCGHRDRSAVPSLSGAPGGRELERQALSSGGWHCGKQLQIEV